MNYSFVEATFEDAFIGVSANHPNAADLNGDGTASEIQVNAGDRIPGIPEHSFKIGGNYNFNEKFSVGANMIYNSTINLFQSLQELIICLIQIMRLLDCSAKLMRSLMVEGQHKDSQTMYFLALARPLVDLLVLR